jgi:hypothetical protein
VSEAVAEKLPWIEDLEIEDAQIKWAWSHFNGLADDYNDEGDLNFQVIIPPEEAARLADIGWNIRESDGLEEGDPPQYLLKCVISYRFEDPLIYLIKGSRKIRAKEEDIPDIRRDTCERIDVIIKPSRWTRKDRSGVSAYVKELYATVRESRFSERYAELDEVR